MKKVVRSEHAPAAVGPYSQAIHAAGLLWVSGQIPLDPATGSLVQGNIEEQTRRALLNLRSILEACGSGLDRLLRTTVYLIDLGDFEAMNRVYSGLIPEPYPARSCVEVCQLPRGARVEIDAIALAD